MVRLESKQVEVLFAARAREDVEKLDTRARKDVTRLRHIALVSLWQLFCFIFIFRENRILINLLYMSSRSDPIFRRYAICVALALDMVDHKTRRFS